MDSAHKPTPVILDTDIGSDIDDTWALAMMLKSPELDVRLVVSDEGDTQYRTDIIGKMLETAGRTDVDVGVGICQEEHPGPQSAWVEGYELAQYPGRVHADGVDAIVRTIMDNPDPITLICIGPVPNIAEALRREPGIAGRAHFVGMHGSFEWSHENGHQIAEYNVVKDAPACRAVFEAPWLSATITPVDTCGRVVLDGARYQRLLQSRDPLLSATLNNYRTWATHHQGIDPSQRSSILFDTVAIYLTYANTYCDMHRMHLTVTGNGFTQPSDDGAVFDVALKWRDFDGYLDHLVERLLAPVVPARASTVTAGETGSR